MVVWWGISHDTQGHRYGYEAVVFRFAYLRAAIPSLRFDTVYRVDTALTDENGQSFSGVLRYVEPASGKTTMSSTRLRIEAGAVAMDRLAGTGLRYRVQATAPDGSRLDLTVSSEKPPLLIGGSGRDPHGDTRQLLLLLAHSFAYLRHAPAARAWTPYRHGWYVLDGPPMGHLGLEWHRRVGLDGPAARQRHGA